MNTESLTLTVKATAKCLGISRNATYRGIHSGEIPSIRIGKRILVPRVAIDRLLSGTSIKALENKN